MISKAYRLALALLFAAAVPAFAQQDAPPTSAATAAPRGAASGVTWSSLNPAQQKLLQQRFGDKWNTLPPERQQALARGSERWLSMSPQQQGMATQRFQHFRALPPEQKQMVRERWQKFRALPPEQQSSIRDNFRKFRNLPPDRRRMLRERWRSATPAQRQHMLQNMREQRMKRLEHRQPNRP